MYLPMSSGAATQWALWDYQTKFVRSDPAAADGLMAVQLDQVPSGYLWLVDRVVVQTTSTTDTVAFLYLDAVDDSRVLDGTRVGNFDVADQAAPIMVPAGTVLLCQWQGASPGAVGMLRAQITVLQSQAAAQ